MDAHVTEFSGFIQDPLEVVQRLRNDLGDRYKRGFPVLKELVQNADDAQATHVIFGLVPGIPEAKHPLLQGNGLFIINNGVFEAKHDRGIRSYGTSNKVADRAAVGKFGLGMKSVFHFCEAFFFLGHIAEQGEISRIVNPWSVPEHLRDEFYPVHPRWEEFASADASLMRSALKPITRNLPNPVSDTPFIVWLPLRKEAHRWEDGEDTGVIVQEFPGDGDGALGFLQDPTLPMQIADLLPLLRYVEEIRFQPLVVGRYSPYCAKIGSGAQRLRFLPAPGEQTLQGKVTGEISVRGGDATASQVKFLGRETHRWIDDLRSLYDGGHWPETHSTDHRGRAKVELDKAEPHAAVVLTSAPAQSDAGILTIRWAVFLPLEETLVSETVQSGGDQDFCFTLHGHFFVDAGRRGIHGFDVLGKGQADEPVDSVDAVRIGWNQRLATKETLPQLLPVLDEYVASLGSAQKDVTGRILATALSNSGVWKRFRSDIAASGQWVLGLGRTGATWQLVESGRVLLPLPAPPERDRERPWRVFPALELLEETCVLVVARAPQLSEKPVDAPDSAQIEILLRSVSASETLSKKTELSYLADTLELVVGPGVFPNPHIGRLLVMLLREGLQRIGLRSIRANRPEIQRLMGFLPQHASLALPESLPPTLLEQLMNCPIDLLVLPSDLCPREQGDQTRLSTHDAEQLLRIIAICIREEPAQGRNSLVLNEVQRLAGLVNETSRASLFRTLNDQDLIRAFDGRAMEWRAVAPHDVEKAQEASLLFRKGQVGDDQGLALARQLQNTLAGGRVLVLERGMLGLLGLDDHRVSSCDAKGVLHALGSQPHALQEPSARKDLVRQLADPGEDEAAKRGLRFLLHGKEGHWNDLTTPLWFRDAQEGAAWERLWSQLNEDWNLIDPGIAQYVSDPVRRSLGVNRIRPRELLEVVAREGVAKIDPTAYTSEECTEILQHAYDDVVWRMLPLHECMNGSRSDALGKTVYLDTGLVVPEDLRDQVRIVRRSLDDSQRQRQQRLLQLFSPEERLRLILGSAEPARFADSILSDIEAMKGHVHSDVRDLLAGTPWVPDANGAAFKPSDIIDCRDPSGLIRDLATQLTEGVYTFVGLLSPELLEHPGFEFVQQLSLLAQGDTAVQTLGLLIAEFPNYHLGGIHFVDDGEFLTALPVLAGMPHLPGWSLLENLTKDHDPAQITAFVVGEMAQPLDNELNVVLDALNWIRQQGRADEGRRVAFELYLRRFAELPGAKSSIADLSLIDNGGHWRPARQLCARAEDIERRFVLCDSQHRILHQHLVSAGTLLADQGDATIPSHQVAGTEFARLLERFFSSWCDKVPEALIGCFAFVCGSAPEVQDLVERYRGNRTGLRDWFKAKLPWSKRPDEHGPPWTWAYINWKTPEEAMDRFEFSAVLVGENEVIVTSILGEPLRVKRTSSAKTFVTVRGDADRVLIQLAPVDVNDRAASELSEMLRNSIRAIAEKWADNRLGDLSSLWTELETSDQIAIHVSRSLILESLPILSTQLKLKHHDALDQAFKIFDEARAQVVEFRGHERVAEFEEEKREALLQIRNLIENSEAARGTLLEGVRSKIRDYQYKRESIPFELFQNADDAVRERLEIDQYNRGGLTETVDSQPDIHRFVVAIEKEAVTFMHWGRPLNATGDPFPGRERGYHRDLQKMLIIGASGKERPATGKFGLGFKSVFLGCDEPELVSGRLSTRILGGMLPVQLNDDSPLRNLLKEHAPARASAGTAIRLSTNAEMAETILRHFQVMAGVLCCFAKCIRQIDFVGRASHTWQPRQLPFAPALSVGTLTVPDPSDGMIRIQALRIQLGDGAMLLGSGGEGIRETARHDPHALDPRTNGGRRRPRLRAQWPFRCRSRPKPACR